LKDSVEFASGYKYNLFFRSPLKARTGGGGAIGFNTAQNKEDGPKILGKIPLYQPDELFPIPTELAFDNELFRALSVQQHYTEIDVQLMPRTLMMEEVDLIRQVAKNTSLIQNAIYNPKELEWFADYLSKFTATTNEKFLISVLLKRKGGQVQQHVKTAVQNYFFGNAQVSERF
jgi:hypothetical protein